MHLNALRECWYFFERQSADLLMKHFKYRFDLYLPPKPGKLHADNSIRLIAHPYSSKEA